MTDYVIRVQDRTVPASVVYTTGWVQTGQQMADLVQPVYKNALQTRVYLYEIPLSGPAPLARGVFPTIDPADETHIICYVTTLGGANLFDFDFTLATP